MVEGTELTGVARTAANASAVLLGLGSLLPIVALILPWWVGRSAVGALANEQMVDSSITLWAFDLSIGTQVSDGAGGTTLKTTKFDMTWDQMCATTAATAGTEPEACGRIRAVRAFAILAPLFGLPGTLALLQSRSVSPLLLVAGALLGILTGVWAIAGVVLGIFVSTDGLAGFGVIAILAGAMLSFIGVAGALYGAGVAMPADAPPPPKRFTRQQRVKEQLEMDLEERRALDERTKAQRVGSAYDDGDGSSVVSTKKVPMMLKRVLFWNQEHSGEVEAESIPTELLEMAFREMDTNGNGTIDLDELVTNLNLCGLKASPEATANIMRDIDKDCSGEIDIHEFVGFFRELEELDRFQAKSQQRAQFAQFLCNFCFIAHIIIVSVLMMEFINMKPADNPDNYLIYQNMLLAFSVVLAILLVSVICVPAARLTIGSNLKAWERQYNVEREKRMKKKKPRSDDGNTKGPRQAAWGTSANAAEGLTELTVNAAMFGASYRLTKQQNVFLQDAHAQMEITAIGGGGGRQASHTSSVGSWRQPSKLASSVKSGGSGVVVSRGGNFERYDPDAYRAAALASMQHGVASSFSPMQVRDLSLPRIQEPEVPGFLALEMPCSPPATLTGTGFYHREL